jgi:hypothetical protein
LNPFWKFIALGAFAVLLTVDIRQNRRWPAAAGGATVAA